MARKRYSAEQVIHRLREAEIRLATGQVTGEVVREPGISERTCYRWRKLCGGMQVGQAKKLKALFPLSLER